MLGEVLETLMHSTIFEDLSSKEHSPNNGLKAFQKPRVLGEP